MKCTVCGDPVHHSRIKGLLHSYSIRYDHEPSLRPKKSPSVKFEFAEGGSLEDMTPGPPMKEGPETMKFDIVKFEKAAYGSGYDAGYDVGYDAGLEEYLALKGKFDKWPHAESEFAEAIVEIAKERQRQDEKWGKQDHDGGLWLKILMEEIGEVSQAMLHDEFGGRAAGTVDDELVQVAAVVVQWMECRRRQGGG